MTTPDELATQLHSIADQVGALGAGGSAAATSADQAPASTDQEASAAADAAGAPPPEHQGLPAAGPTSPVPGTDAVVVQADEQGQPQSIEAIADSLNVNADALRAINAGHLGSAVDAPPAGTVLAVPPSTASAASDQAASDASTSAADAASATSTNADATASSSSPDQPTAGEVVSAQEDTTNGNP